MYLDDGLCAVKGEENAHMASRLVQTTLEKSGFVANVAKSNTIQTSFKPQNQLLDSTERFPLSLLRSLTCKPAHSAHQPTKVTSVFYNRVCRPCKTCIYHSLV